MGYAKPSDFLRDKQQFFSQPRSKSNISFNIEDIETQARNKDYRFLLQNHKALEAEFTQQFNALQSLDDKNKTEFWLYSYYCATLLETFYISYGQAGTASNYAAIKQKIKNRLNNKTETPQDEQDFIHSLYDSFIGGLSNLINAPFHIAKIRDYVAYTNLCRLYWVFTRLTLTTGFATLNAMGIIEKIDAILGTHTDVSKVIATLQAPTAIINYFSVGLFLARLLIDGGLLIKHAFFPTELEKGADRLIHKMNLLPGVATIESFRNTYILIQKQDDSELELYYVPGIGSAEKLTIRENAKLKASLLEKMNTQNSVHLTSKDINDLITEQTGHIPETTTWWDRFKFELYKRHCNLANDFVWGSVNLLTNYNFLFGIPGPLAGYITAAFLAFDVGMALYRCHLAHEEYQSKMGQYLQEIDDYKALSKNSDLTPEQSNLYKMHLEMLNKQLSELRINWQTKEATFYFVAAAAALLMMGFTTAILVSSPLIVVGGFFVCVLAAAMYFSAGAYSQYKEKSICMEDAEFSGINLPCAAKEYEKARNEFIFTMVKNTVIPIILISTFAICWPAAIVLTAMYVGYEIYHAYDQHCATREAKQLKLLYPLASGTGVNDDANHDDDALTDNSLLCFN